MITGKVSSFQSMGAVDGPGVRCVIFLQGCPLRCIYCHNPETWEIEGGEEYTVEEMLQKIRRFASFIKKGGGVTVSGGEALMQWQFTAALFKRMQAEGFHTALDTSGVGPLEGSEAVLEHTDLVICDLKFPTRQLFAKYCRGEISKVLDFLSLTEQKGIPLWIRHVVVPGLTDSEGSIRQIAELARRYSNLEKIELLPFRKLCIPKYEALGLEFPMRDVKECGTETIEKLKKVLER